MKIIHHIQPRSQLPNGFSISKPFDYNDIGNCEYIIAIPLWVKKNRESYDISADEITRGRSVFLLTIRKFKDHPRVTIMWGWVRRDR